MPKTRPNKLPSLSPPGDVSTPVAILVIMALVAVFFRDILLEKAFFWEDFIYQYYPFRHFAAVAMAGGTIPLWNPYTFNGYPFQADIQSAIFYIPNLLLTFAVSGGHLHYLWLEVQIVVHYMIAGVTMFFLARSYEIKPNYALFSGLVFALSGFTITRAIHHTVICETAWLPLIALLFKKTLERRSWSMMLLTGFVLGQTILAGFPQMSLYIGLMMLFMFVYEFGFQVKDRGWKEAYPLIWFGAGAVLLAAACSAIQLLPTAQLAPFSQRAELSYEKSLYGSLSWSDLVILVVPKFLGATGAGGSTFWGPGEYGQYWETCFYLGIAGLVFAIAGASLFRRHRFVILWTALAVFSLLYALGDNFILHRIFYYGFPGFNKFRIPGRLSFLFTPAAAILAGAGLERLVESMDERAKFVKRLLGVAAAAGLLLWGLVQAGAFSTAPDTQTAQFIRDTTTSETTVALILVLAVCGVIFARLKGVLSTAAMIVLLFSVQFIDINIFGFSQNNGATSPDEYYRRYAPVASKMKEEGQKEIFRVNSRSSGAMMLDRNQGMIDHIFLMEGYTPLAIARTYPPGHSWEQVCDMLNAKYRVVVDNAHRTMSLAASTTYLPRAYVVYDVRHFGAEDSVKRFMESDVFDPHRQIVLEGAPPLISRDTVYSPKWSARITSYGLNSISLSNFMPKPGYLVLSEMYYPGWNAYVDGGPGTISRANWNLRAIPLIAGPHTVEVRYEPENFYIGKWITLIFSAVSIVGSILLRRYR